MSLPPPPSYPELAAVLDSLKEALTPGLTLEEIDGLRNDPTAAALADIDFTMDGAFGIEHRTALGPEDAPNIPLLIGCRQDPPSRLPSSRFPKGGDNIVTVPPGHDAPSPAPAGPPPPATRATALVTAALRIVDDSGTEALTMRRLADANKLQLPAIYRVFSNKQNLLDEMAEAIPAKVLPDGRESDGKAEVALLARQLRQALPAQREDARIIGGGYAAKRHSPTLVERLVGVMRRAGFNGVAALWATSTVFC